MHRSRQHRQNLVQLERLQEIIEGTRLHGFQGRLHGRLTGHDDADQLRIDFKGLAEQLDAVHFRHHQVAEQEIEVLGAQQRQTFGGRGRGPYDVVVAGEIGFQRLGQIRLILHDQYPAKVGLRHVQSLKEWGRLPACPTLRP